MEDRFSSSFMTYHCSFGCDGPDCRPLPQLIIQVLGTNYDVGILQEDDLRIVRVGGL